MILKIVQIIEDWAFNTVLTPEEIDKERRSSRGIQTRFRLKKRMMGRYLSKMMHDSHYAELINQEKKC
jgi:zinc protease